MIAILDGIAKWAQRTHDAAEIMAEIVAKQLVEHLRAIGACRHEKPPIGGGAAIGRGRRTMMLQWLHREARWLAMADAGG